MAAKYAVSCQYQKKHHNQDTGEHIAKRAPESAGAGPNGGAGLKLKILESIGILTGFAVFPDVAILVSHTVAHPKNQTRHIRELLDVR